MPNGGNMVRRLVEIADKPTPKEYVVKLTYFKSSGKYYTDGEYKTTQDAGYKIVDEVADMLLHDNAPGLAGFDKSFWVLIDPQDHPAACPHLLKPILAN